jgi:integrase
MNSIEALNDLLKRVSTTPTQLKSVAAPLTAPPQPPAVAIASVDRGATLGQFIAAYIERRTDIKPSTRINLCVAGGRLIGYFGYTKLLAEITEGDADDWRLWLGTEVKTADKVDHRKLAENTIRRMCGRARQLFRAAVKKRLIAENPFGEMKGIMSRGNKAREYFISRAEAQAVLTACPTPEWRVIFALARFGGMRTPSETLSMRWQDIDFERGRMTVHSPKTEHHEGGDRRTTPLFPEVRRELEAIHKPGACGYIVDERRRRAAMGIHGWANSNLRTAFTKIVWQAGIKPWPKLFHNLRATRQTELCELFPAHVVCAWLGNSEIIAKRHYLQVTDAHFAAATKGDAVIGGAK